MEESIELAMSFFTGSQNILEHTVDGVEPNEHYSEFHDFIETAAAAAAAAAPPLSTSTHISAVVVRVFFTFQGSAFFSFTPFSHS